MRENRTPGIARGTSDNGCSYRERLQVPSSLAHEGVCEPLIFGGNEHPEENIYPSHELLEPVYEEFGRRKAILYFHPTGCGACSPMVNAVSLEWVTGALIEDQLVILHLLHADIPPAHYPGIKLPLT